MKKDVVFSGAGRKRLFSGIEKVSRSVISTMGVGGRNVVFKDEYGNLRSTKDGVTVAKNLSNLKDPVENFGAMLIKQASVKTAEQAGDGTTTSTLLAYHLISKSLNHLDTGANSVELKNGIEFGASEIIKALSEIKTEINSSEQIKQVATLSANGDETIGDLITEGINYVGADGIVVVEESKTGETKLEKVEGIQFDRGYKSHYFVTDQSKMTCDFSDAYILMVDERISSANDLLPILEFISSEQKPLVVVAEEVEGEAIATLIVNHSRGIIKACAIKAPEFGDRRTLFLEDLAIITGGKVFNKNKGLPLSDFDPQLLGKCRTINVKASKTTIVDGAGDSEEIKSRILDIKSQIDSCESNYEKEKLQQRLGKLVGGVAIVSIGGRTDVEIKERKDRAEDALYATYAAIEEGILVGGGCSFMKALTTINNTAIISDNMSDSYWTGFKILLSSVKEPFFQILRNAGYGESDIYGYVPSISNGDSSIVNPLSGEVVDAFELGVIDPFKVTRTALENAVSVAGTVILTECVIFDEDEEKQEPSPYNFQ